MYELIINAMKSCRKDIFRMFQKIDYCEKCLLLEKCTEQEKTEKEAQE